MDQGGNLVDDFVFDSGKQIYSKEKINSELMLKLKTRNWTTWKANVAC